MGWNLAQSKDKRGLWITERFSPYEEHRHHLKKMLVQKQTKFQKMIIAQSSSFGRCLILDGEVQSAQSDEFIYHEALAHPALTIHPNPKRALIMGGGEGATLREILRHQALETAVMVDLDGEVVDACKKYLPSWHQNAFQHPKVQVIVEDAKAYLERYQGPRWDIIISDLPTPIGQGPAVALYTKEFYQTLRSKLAGNGTFVLQAGSGSLVQIDFHVKLYRTLTSVFSIVRPYYAFVPSFDVPWAFFLATQEETQDPLEFSTKSINNYLQEKLIVNNLRFYDGQTHVGLFHVPKYLRELLKAQGKTITIKEPALFYK